MSELKRILSLGAGWQSSCLFEMSCDGEIDRLDAAVFADTQAELGDTYRHLDYLRALGRKAGIPVHVVTAGSLRDVVEDAESNRTLVPLYFWNEAEDGPGRTRQKCTHDFKTVPKVRWLKEYMREHGICGHRLPTEPVIEHWFGYSSDEWRRAQRRSVNAEAWERVRFPLLEMRMDRWACREWMVSHGHPEPPRSACDFCPNRANVGWRWLRDEHPEHFANAVRADWALRNLGDRGIDNARGGSGFLHHDLLPLDEVDLRSEDDKHGQMGFEFGGCASGECGT